MSSACADHPCDNCPTCQSGACCGAEVYDANLPAEGSWPGRSVVPVGEVRTQDGKLVCHICGTAHHGLYLHIRFAHKLSAEEYRAYFGLRVSEPLASEAMREARRHATPEVDIERLAQWRQAFTAEQRSAWSRNRVQRAGANGVGTRDGKQGDRARQAAQQRAEDPAKAAQWKGKIRARRRKKDGDGFAPVITCQECGAQFSLLSTHARPVSPRKTCGSKECVSAVRRKAQAASAAARRATR